MSKKICFSSVLKQKRGYQNVQNVLNRQAPQASLRQMMQNFQSYPNGDFTLRYHSIRGCSSKQGFDQNFNQLDQFIQNHLQNQQNISDTQPRKTIPSQLLKFIPGNKSPKRISQTKSGFTSTQQHKNVDMKQICKEYAENKKNGRDLGKAPVWRFNSKNQDYEVQEQKQIVHRPNYNRQSQKTIKQSKVQQKYQQTRNQSRFNQNKQFNKINSQNNLNVQKQQNTTKGKNNILKLVEQIKSNIVPEIEQMAQRIIHQRTKGQDQQLLLSQRQSEEQKGQKRIDNAKKQIGQYLSMKVGNGSSLQNKGKQTTMAPIQKTNQNSFKQIQQRIGSSNQNVGYSFSSDFPSQNYCKPNQSSNNAEYLVKNSSHSQDIQMPKTKKQLQVNNTSFNNISLPNIDEVKSEKDPNQRLQQDFGESVAINLRNVSKADPQSIDKNFIKQIQSVAYTEPEPYSRQNPISYNKISQKMQHENQKMARQPEKVEKKKSGSLFQQISKTALSIEANNQQQDSQQVNISIAQSRQSPNIRSNQSSARNQNKKNTSPAVQVNSFLAPANTVKIQFKKLPSPRRTSKQNLQFKQQVKESFKVQINKANQTFTQANTSLLNKGSTKIQPLQNYIRPQQQPYRTSFSNILQQNNKNSPVSMEKTIQHHTIQMPIINSKHMTSQIQPTFTYNPIINTTSNNSGSNTNIPTQTVQQHQQNSRQRNNSLKNSNHDDQSRKLKITISPKYHGNQHDRHDLIANVGDFKLGNVKMQESTQANKYIKVSNVGNSIQKKLTPSTNQASKIPPASSSSSITVKDSINNNKTRVDNILSNIPKFSNAVVTQKRQTVQQKRQNPQEHALIRIQKYQRVEKVVQPAPPAKTKQSVSIKNNQSIKSSQQFEFDLDF